MARSGLSKSGCTEHFVKTQSGFFRRERPCARWWHRLLLPGVVGSCGVTLGSALSILTVSKVLVVSICLLLPWGPFVLICLGSLVGLAMWLAWWRQACRALKEYEAHRDLRLERALKRAVAATSQHELAGSTGQPAYAAAGNQTENETTSLMDILGDIPQPRTPRWKHLDPANLPPYPVLPDACRRPLQRTRMK